MIWDTIAAIPLAQLATFVAGGLMLNVAPGQDVFFASACGIQGGPRAGALAGFGVGLGVLMHVTLATVGLGAVVAAATSAPITGMLLVFEMTNDYNIILPLMLTTVIANLVARRLEPDSLYSGWLRRRGERLQHGADRDVLAGLRVADAFDRAPHVRPAALRPRGGTEAHVDALVAELRGEDYVVAAAVEEHAEDLL